MESKERMDASVIYIDSLVRSFELWSVFIMVLLHYDDVKS